MASSVIHMAVASEINKKLKRDSSKLLIGTIAPDISKLVGQNKSISHFFVSKEVRLPDMEKFLDKYRNNLDDDFVMGYYIHLYTDYLWFKYFLDDFSYCNIINAVDGSVVRLIDKKMYVEYIYNDYTNINIKLIDKYNLVLDVFYEELPIIDYIIEEIPMDKLSVVVDNAGRIIANSKSSKPYFFDIDNVEKFISLAVELILSDIEKL